MMRRRERKEKAEQDALRIRLSPCDYKHERSRALSRNGLRPRAGVATSYKIDGKEFVV